MLKNISGQKLIVYAWDSTTDLPKTGDAANLTAYVSKDWGTVTVLADTSATEMDAAKAPGYYLFDLAQGETNANTLLYTAVSMTGNIVVRAVPETCFTVTQLADGVAHGGTPGSSTATFAMKQWQVVAQDADTSAVIWTGLGTGHGGYLEGGATSGSGLYTEGNGTGNGWWSVGGASAGIGIYASSAAGPGMYLTGSYGLLTIGTAGPGTYMIGSTNSEALKLQAGVNGRSLLATGAVLLQTTLGVTGATTLTGIVTFGSDLFITGATSFSGAVSAIDASNDIRVNVQYVNGTEVTGTGAAGDEWGPLP